MKRTTSEAQPGKECHEDPFDAAVRIVSELSEKAQRAIDKGETLDFMWLRELYGDIRERAERHFRGVCANDAGRCAALRGQVVRALQKCNVVVKTLHEQHEKTQFDAFMREPKLAGLPATLLSIHEFLLSTAAAEEPEQLLPAQLALELDSLIWYVSKAARRLSDECQMLKCATVRRPLSVETAAIETLNLVLRAALACVCRASQAASGPAAELADCRSLHEVCRKVVARAFEDSAFSSSSALLKTTCSSPCLAQLVAPALNLVSNATMLVATTTAALRCKNLARTALKSCLFNGLVTAYFGDPRQCARAGVLDLPHRDPGDQAQSAASLLVELIELAQFEEPQGVDTPDERTMLRKRQSGRSKARQGIRMRRRPTGNAAGAQGSRAGAYFSNLSPHLGGALLLAAHTAIKTQGAPDQTKRVHESVYWLLRNMEVTHGSQKTCRVLMPKFLSCGESKHASSHADVEQRWAKMLCALRDGLRDTVSSTKESKALLDYVQRATAPTTPAEGRRDMRNGGQIEPRSTKV